MTLREFVQHLLLNGELDDDVEIEAKIPQDSGERFACFIPFHVTHLGDDFGDRPITLIECKPYHTEG